MRTTRWGGGRKGETERATWRSLTPVDKARQDPAPPRKERASGGLSCQPDAITHQIRQPTFCSAAASWPRSCVHSEVA